MERVKLLSVCDVYQPHTIATKEFILDGKYTVYGANGPIGLYSKFNHAEPEVLMACRGATCGAINVSEPYSWINGNAMVIHPNGTIPLSKKYLQYYLVSAKKESIISGTAQPQITCQNMREFEVPICNLSEQNRIVARIEELFSELDSGVETLKTVKQQLEVYRQAVLKQAFSQATNMVTFGSIMNSRLGKMLDKDKNLGIPRKYLRNINVRWFSFDLSDLLEMRIEESETDKYTISKNDLVICEGGEPGRCAVWDEEDSVFYQKALHRVRFNDDSNPKFYMYYLWFAAQTGNLSPFFTGMGIKHLTGQSLVKVPVPSTSRAVQDEIVSEIESHLSVCDSIEKTVDTALQQAEAMRQSILKQAFEGRL